MNSNINRSNEIIKNLQLANDQIESHYAYPYAFGWAWAMLTDEQRDQMLKLAEQKAKENN